MTREDIDIIIKALCPNDEDYEKPIISPSYLKRELEALALEQEPNIKSLGEDMRICRESITDEKVLIGFNMAVALCNKHLGESEDEE